MTETTAPSNNGDTREQLAAKSLGQNLINMVQAYEQRSGESVPTLDDLRARVS